MNKTKTFLSRNVLSLVVVGMFIFVSLYNSSFLSKLNLTGLLVEISYMTFLAIGMTFAIVTGGIDLSVGAVAGLSTVVIARMMRDLNFSNDLLTIIAAITMALSVCTLIGYINGLLVTIMNIPPLIVTLGMTWVATGLGNSLVKGKPIALKISGLKNVITYKIGTWVPVMFILSIAALIIMIYILDKTRFGRSFYAVGSSRYTAYISGMNTKRVLRQAYLISGLCAGIAGVLIAANLNSGYPGAATDYELYTIAAVVMGGISLTGGEGRLWNAFLGVIILRILKKIVVFTGLSNISGFMEGIIVGTLLVLVLYFNSLRKGVKA